MGKLEPYYSCAVYPSGRFTVTYHSRQGSHQITDATIPGTSPNPKPLIEQAEESARTYVEMDKQRRVKAERDSAGARRFSIPA